MNDTTVLSLGGSMVAPDEIAVDFLVRFRRLVCDYLEKDQTRRLIFVIGGGSPARRYQKAYREIRESANNNEADWIGIAATRLNARLVKAVFEEHCLDDVVTDPTARFDFTGRILVAAGWKPGFSTDYDAVLLAERFKSKTLINLTNIAKVYTADPKKDTNAKPLDAISWEEFSKITGTEWIPGKNTPFDPAAVKKAWEIKLVLITALGSDLKNLRRILTGSDYVGTTVGPG